MSRLEDIMSEYEFDTESISPENSKTIAVMTKYVRELVNKYYTKQQSEIKRLKKRVTELEAKLKDSNSVNKKGGEAAAAAPEVKILKPIMISEYSDAYLITGKGTFDIRNILKKEFKAIWNGDCRGWKIFKVTDGVTGMTNKTEMADKLLIDIRDKINDLVSKVDFVRDNAERSFTELYG